jgi:hypothetical protein
MGSHRPRKKRVRPSGRTRDYDEPVCDDGLPQNVMLQPFKVP